MDNIRTVAEQLLARLEEARAALPDAWLAHLDGVPKELIDRITRDINLAKAALSAPPQARQVPVTTRILVGAEHAYVAIKGVDFSMDVRLSHGMSPITSLKATADELRGTAAATIERASRVEQAIEALDAQQPPSIIPVASPQARRAFG
jgi:hypothetical protein